MGCGCGGRKSTTDYEVTFRDGSRKTVRSISEARIAVQTDTSQGSRSATFKAVPRTTS